MFNQSFEGQTRSRPAINLSGSAAAASTSSASSSAGPSTPGEHNIANRARLERAHREQQRKLERNARSIQAFYRSRRTAGLARDAIRQQYDALAGQSGCDSQQLSQATRLLAFIFTPIINAKSQSTRPRCMKADLDRLGRWSRTMAVGKPRVALFQQFEILASNQDELSRYCFLLKRLARTMLAQAADNASSPTIPLFLELTRQLLDPSKYTGLAEGRLAGFPQELASYLVEHGGLEDLRSHIMSFPSGQRPLSPSIAPSISISLSLLLRTTNTSTYDSTCQAFLSNILTIPQLLTPRRLSPNALNSLVGPTSSLPLFDLLGSLNRTASSAQDQATQVKYAYLLSNLITIVSKRLVPSPGGASLKNGQELVTTLNAFRICLDNLPTGLLAGEPKGKSADTAIDVGLNEDEDMAGDTARTNDTSQLDPVTYGAIEQLASENLLSALVAASTRYSGTSRPALSSFLVALIYSWPSKRESIVNTLVYSDMVAAGRGVIRELWRGWIRPSNLMKAISGSSGQASSGVTNAVINTFSNSQYKDDWPHLILLAELYARTLLTLGDDEFFANAAGPGRAAAPLSRNPLTTDEVIGLSGLFRNIAFTLYWQPEVLLNATGQPNYVTGSKVSLEGLRSLSTQLLQMIHARDSRRHFTPSNHWIMTSQMDVKSFIESVLVEDRELNDEADGTTADVAMEDADNEEAFGRRPIDRRARNIPSRRQMAYVSPRLGVLNNIPFVIPFETRVSIFQQFVANDRHRVGLSGLDRNFNFGLDGRGIAGRGTIRRGHVADDGFRAFSGLGSHLKGRLAIRFIDEYGQEEAGIDGGGLFKEFLTSLSKEAFDIDRGLWAENRNHELYPTSTSYSREAHSLQWYAFLGRMMGKALYEGILVDVPFAPFFLSKWLGRASGFDDLASFDPDLYQGLVQLKNYTGNVEKDMSLNFTVSEEDFGVSRTIDLVRNGSSIPVTNENRISYIYRVSDYRLNKQIEKQCSAFFSGLSDLVDPKWLRMFNQVELGLLVGGAETGINVDDLRHNTIYSRDYDESNPTIQYFWKVVESFSQEDKKALIKFCTSCPRPPLLGFGQLNPKFAIASGGTDENRMPSASTCVNLLKLPAYSSPERLKQKLLASIHSGAGFDLS